MGAGGEIHVGTPGWSYADWSGAFYPEGIHGAERLSWYATRFDTVEVNASFYRLPHPGTISGWNRRLGPGFYLVSKGSRSVAHLRKLRHCDEPLRAFFERILALRSLRVVPWQLPPGSAGTPAGWVGISLRCREAFATRWNSGTRAGGTRRPQPS